MSVFKKGGDFNYIKFSQCPLEFGNKYLLHLRLAAQNKREKNRHIMLANKYLYCFIRHYLLIKADYKKEPNKEISINGYKFNKIQKKELLIAMQDFAIRNKIELTENSFNFVRLKIQHTMIYS